MLTFLVAAALAFGAIFIAALAATQGALPTWIGSTGGEVGAKAVAVAVGRQVGHRLSPRMVRIGSAALFAVTGVTVLLGAMLA